MVYVDKEGPILDAVFEKGCRSLQAIADISGIPYKQVHYFFESRYGGINCLRELRQEEDIAKAVPLYEKGMTLRELWRRSGVPEHRLRPIFSAIRKEERKQRKAAEERKRLTKEFREIHDSIMGSMDAHIHARSMEEDPIYACAFNLRITNTSHLPFTKLYSRLQDIYAGKSIYECRENWDVSSNEYVRHFIDNIGLYDLYKQKHFERLVPDLEKKETAILEAICDKHCTNILEISEATEIDKKEVDMILKHAGLKKELAESKRVLEYEAVVKVYKDKVDEMPLPSEIAEATGMASITASKAGLYMRRFRDEVRKRRAREKHPELFA
jgi:hypothetical protein